MVFKSIKRRKFLHVGAMGFLGTFLGRCGLPTKSKDTFSIEIKRPSLKLGHLFRDGFSFPEPKESEYQDVLIIGGGISGLSAARKMTKTGIKKVKLLEMEPEVGGNSRSGSNQWGAYPLGAHYLPLPSLDSVPLINFLKEADVITGFDLKGIPEYNPYYLCHDPHERLFIHGYWQEGLIPQKGIPKADEEQIERFQDHMKQLRFMKGGDGRWLFDLPIDLSSEEPSYRRLDEISFAQWLTDNGFTSPYLLWYCNYCMRDDYGGDCTKVSAWAGIHYFCSRREDEVHEKGSILTWPEGNAFLMKALRRQSDIDVGTSEMAIKIEEKGEEVEVVTYLADRQVTKRYRSRQVILCTPAMLSKRLLSEKQMVRPASVPWVVCNVSLKVLHQGPGLSLCWDNVFYGSQSLGYIYANHQSLKTHHDAINLSLYWPMDQEDISTERRSLLTKDEEYWKSKVIKELSIAHRISEEDILHIEVWQWGHGMVRPEVNYLWNKRLKNAPPTANRNIHFAHTDFGGISVFEEAFYQGYRAAESVIDQLKNG